MATRRIINIIIIVWVSCSLFFIWGNTSQKNNIHGKSLFEKRNGFKAQIRTFKTLSINNSGGEELKKVMDSIR